MKRVLYYAMSVILSNMKRLLATIILMLTMTASSFAVEVEINGLWYELSSETKEAKVIQYKNDNKYSGDVIMPETVEYEGASYSVTGIEKGAFIGCMGLTSITIPNSVTSIGDYAFRECSSLTFVTIPNSVTSIGEYAFRECSGLTSITIPNSVTSIQYSAFEKCTCLTSVTIGSSVTSIGGYAFYGCIGLTSVTISNSVTSIGESAFKDCSSLTSVTIPNSVTSIGDYAFYYCTGLTSVTIGNSVKSIGSGAFSCCGIHLTSVYISDLEAWCKIAFESGANPLSTAHHLFLNGEEIKDLVIPNSVTSIGSYAFKNCSDLTSITIPNNVTSIGNESFSGCCSLTSVTIPNSVTSIGYGAFEYCSGLTSITIPNSVTSIKNSAFVGCSSLTSVTIPQNVTSIEDYTFGKCSGLTSITIPNSVTSIGESAFGGCSGLTTITIGSGVETIIERAFANCPELTDVYCHAENVPSMKDNKGRSCTDVFENSSIDYATLHVPTNSIYAYKSTEPWSGFKEIVGLDGSMPETPKCATPTISYENGEIVFGCETEGVEYISEVTAPDANKYNDSKISLSQVYKVSVYAVKNGYDNSDTVTAEIHISGGQTGDTNGDGVVNAADIVAIVNIIMTAE